MKITQPLSRHQGGPRGDPLHPHTLHHVLPLLLAPLRQKKGRLLISVLAIALGVALGYAVQLINH